MKKRLVACTILAMALVISIGGASWAGQEKGQPGKDDFTNGPGMGRGMGIFKRLNLSDQQGKQVKAILAKHHPEMKALEEKMKAARKSVFAAVHADTFNEQAIRSAHQAMSGEMENMAVLRGKIFSEIRPILTPEQVKQLKELPRRKPMGMGGRPGCPAMKGM